MSEPAVKVGDFVRLPNGTFGFVTEMAYPTDEYDSSYRPVVAKVGEDLGGRDSMESSWSNFYEVEVLLQVDLSPDVVLALRSADE